MKLPQNPLWVHAFITAVFALVCVALIIFSHNAAAIAFAVAALPTLYAIWVPSPTQQNTNAALIALIQRLEPLIVSLVKPNAPPAPLQGDSTDTAITQSLKAVAPATVQSK